MNRMEDCPSYLECSSPLCPLDPQLKERCFYIGEDVCAGRAGSGKRWIAKMRSYNKRKPKTYLDKPLSYQMLYDVSRPKVMTEEQRQSLRERGQKLAQSRQKAKINKIKSARTVAVAA